MNPHHPASPRFRPALELLASALLLCAGTTSLAEVKLPAVFGDHMVLQQGLKNPVWGWASPGEAVTVSIAGQNQAATAGPDGTWRVQLDPLKVGGPFTLTVQGKSTVRFEDVMVGEVWICSGQSNMGFDLRSAYDSDLEIPSANHPNLRLISVPQVGTQEPQRDFKGQWARCAPEVAASFSAVGYFFGLQLHRQLNVPVGLIDNAWGGSSCEAWVRRDVLAADPRYAELLAKWAETEKTYDWEKVQAANQAQLAKWQEAVKKAKAEGKPEPTRPRPAQNALTGQHRPGNLYNGVLLPTIGYGIKGAVWYQGESNAGRAYQYRHLFPLMIRNWRDAWKQGDFPFYWVQLADYLGVAAEPKESAWAELREAQTMTMTKLPNTGQAVIIDVGEGRDIHPRQKLTVGNRLARWALARDYGVKIAYRSPEYKSMAKAANKIVLTFDHVAGGLYCFDTTEPVGFAIAGEDKEFVWAKGRLAGSNQVEVWSDQVKDPVAVRYAWADNPICNLFSREGLPVTPFRTDDWPGVTASTNK